MRLEDMRARVVQPPEDDEELEHHGVDRDPTRLAGFLGRLVPLEHQLTSLQIDIAPFEVPRLSRSATGMAKKHQHLAEPGGGARPLPLLAVRGADLPAAGVAAVRPLPLR